MEHPAISVQHVSKQYRIGLRKERYRTLRDTIADAVSKPFRKIEEHRSTAGADTIWAVRDVSFDVQASEVVGLIGRNGAGKSTLLKILSGITSPTEGRIEIRGRVSSLLEIGTGFHPELTGRENISLNGAILGMTRAEIRRKFDEIVAFAEVDKFIDTPVKRYSSGMQVRLAFAVAAHLEPEILLVDEVLAVGDAQFQRKCIGKMGDVAKNEGRTVIFVSHNMAAVERLCSRSILIREGRVAESGPSEQVIQSYLSTDQSAQAEWIRPGEVPAHPFVKRIALLDESGQPANVITTRSQLYLEIDCVVQEPKPRLQLGVLTYSHLGQPLFSTNPLDDEKPYPVQPGIHRYRVEFPKAIFMPQRYSITVSLYANRENVDSCQNVIVFDTTPVASLANAVDGGRPGLVQLACRWQHEMRPLP